MSLQPKRDHFSRFAALWQSKCQRKSVLLSLGKNAERWPHDHHDYGDGDDEDDENDENDGDDEDDLKDDLDSGE